MMTDVPEDFMAQEGTEVVIGREPPPHTQAPDWVHLSGISAVAAELHTLLKAHVNQKRGDTIVWPSTRSLARLLKLPRRDKVSPFLKELAGIGAIEISRKGMPARNVYVVHSMPPKGYAGPLSVAEWYERNRDSLNAEAEADKVVRDRRAAAKKASDAETDGSGDSAKADTEDDVTDTDTQVTPVTTDTGQQAVTTDSGQQVTRGDGHPVTALEGRKQDEVEPDEGEEKTPAPSGRAGGMTVSEQVSEGQLTLDGKTEPAKVKGAPTNEDRAFGIARGWMEYRATQRKPIAGRNPLHKLKTLVLPFIEADYADDEIKRALNGLGEALPSTSQMQRALDTIRDRRPVAAGHGRPAQNERAGARVNGYWDDVRAEQAASGRNGINDSAPSAEVQTTGAKW